MNVPEKYRVKSGPLSTTTAEDGNNGLFIILRGSGSKQNLTLIAKYPFHHSPNPISHYKARVSPAPAFPLNFCKFPPPPAPFPKISKSYATLLKHLPLACV